MLGVGQTEAISSPPRTFDFSQICRLCAQRNVRIDSPSPSGTPSLVGTGTYFKAWDALMRWIQHQQDSSKAVNIQHFGTVGYIIGNEQKQMYLKLSEKFLFSQGLTLDQARTAQIEQIGKTVLAPTVRANYSEIAKLMGAHSEERAYIATCLTTIFEVVGNLLTSSSDTMIHIDLGLLGIVSAHQQAVFVVPYQKLKPEIHTHHKSKQTVMDLLNIERSGLLSA